MSKKVKAIINTIKKDQRGFSMIELLTAIAILAILAGSVIFVMNSSSQTYNKLSVEAQLQSEAQLVANMITEIAIDSWNAYSEVTDETAKTTTFSMDYTETKNKILILESIMDGVTKQYIIAKKNGKNELYLAERTYDASTKTWGALSDAILGDYITDFSVDTSRVEAENVLRFTLSYEKNGRTYDGNYQVLMRNRAYADSVSANNSPESGSLLSVDLKPEVVYVDIVDDQVTQYYKEEVSDTNKVTNVSKGIEFNATVHTNSSANVNEVDWALERHDKDVFKVETGTSTQNYVVWNHKSKQFKNSPVDSFVVKASKTITLSDGKTPLTRSKSSMILLRRIKGLSLYALSGSTQWRKEYEEYETPGVPSSIAQGYAYPANNGQYMSMTIGATLLASNIEYGGGLRWYVYKQNSAGGWDKIAGYGVTDNPALVTVQDKETLTTTSNVLNFGSAVKNTQVYKVEAVSVFDDSWKAEYIFGIAPPDSTNDNSGEYSIGFYAPVNRLFESKELKPQQDNIAEVDKLVFFKITAIDGAASSAMSPDKIKIIKDENGIIRVYIDYQAFSYSDANQKEDLYTGGFDMHCVIGYYDEFGNLCIAGLESGNYIAELEAQEAPNKVKDGTNEAGDQCKSQARIVYNTGKIEVTKKSPQSDIVVIAKGKSQTFKAVASYYNFLLPRNGMYYMGVYIDDFTNNLLELGKSSINPYFDVVRLNEYGDTNKFVNEARVRLDAKTTSKKYLTAPVTMRIAANDFYLIRQTPNKASYTSYNILLANVEGTETYIAGPEATGSLSWTDEQAKSIENGTKTEIKGQDSAGNEVTAKVYKSNKKYYCEYGGTTYKYNTANDYWGK